MSMLLLGGQYQIYLWNLNPSNPEPDHLYSGSALGEITQHCKKYTSQKVEKKIGTILGMEKNDPPGGFHAAYKTTL